MIVSDGSRIFSIHLSEHRAATIAWYTLRKDKLEASLQLFVVFRASFRILEIRCAAMIVWLAILKVAFGVLEILCAAMIAWSADCEVSLEITLDDGFDSGIPSTELLK